MTTTTEASEALNQFEDEAIGTINEICVINGTNVAINRENRRAMTSSVKSVTNIIRKAKVKYKIVTIEDWINLYLKTTDHQPIGQRLPVDPTNNKTQGILFSLIRGQGIGQITMCDVKGHEIYKWESMYF